MNRRVIVYILISILFINSSLQNLQDKDKTLKSVEANTNTEFVSLERGIDKTKEDLNKYFNGSFRKNLASMPTYGRANSTPWSGSYWPYRYLGISARYSKDSKNTIGTYSSGVDDFVNKNNWCTAKKKYFQPGEHKSLYDTSRFQKYVNDYYSPAEKYDLLVGDTNYTLTNYFKNYASKYGCNVAGWMGICHGWAPAAIYERRPRRSVSVRAADGKTLITFLPDDVKALISQLYSNYNSYKTIFIGYRCTSSVCFSINPGTFVLAAGNRIGLQRKVMLFDQQSDAQIWNFPATEYTMSFFNPNKKGEYTKNYRSVKVARSGGAAGTAYVVGVKFVITYVKENNYTHSNKTKKDEIGSTTYEFTLELDKYDNIIGGEWLYRTRPEYVWRIDWSNGMYGTQDKYVSFSGSVQSLNNVTSYAKKASTRGEVLKAVAEWLVRLSS